MFGGAHAYPHDIGLFEADRWAPAEAIAHGHTPYFKSAATAPPYVAAPYGPLYYALIAVGIRTATARTTTTIPRAGALTALERLYRAVAPPGYRERLG